MRFPINSNLEVMMESRHLFMIDLLGAITTGNTSTLDVPVGDCNQTVMPGLN